MVNNHSIETQPYETQAQLLKLLTHPARLAILEILREGENCVCHMEAHLGYRQAYISQQLMVLREAGLVQDRRDGWNVFYHIAEPCIYAVLTAVEQIIAPENKSSNLVKILPAPAQSAVEEEMFNSSNSLFFVK